MRAMGPSVPLQWLNLEGLGLNWLTSIWRAIQAYHDLPTPSGYTPHQILFRRDRITQDLLWANPAKARDCQEFMANAEEMAAEVTEALTKENQKCVQYQEKAPVAKYHVGHAVWLECPLNLSEHRQTINYVAAEVPKWLSEDTYTLKVGERLFQGQNHTQEKPGVPDPGGRHVQFDDIDIEVDEHQPFMEEN